MKSDASGPASGAGGEGDGEGVAVLTSLLKVAFRVPPYNRPPARLLPPRRLVSWHGRTGRGRRGAPASNTRDQGAASRVTAAEGAGGGVGRPSGAPPRA